jgi:hypothetical protein
MWVSSQIALCFLGCSTSARSTLGTIALARKVSELMLYRCSASIESARKLNYGATDIAINWSGGLHHAKKSEVWPTKPRSVLVERHVPIAGQRILLRK